MGQFDQLNHSHQVHDFVTAWTSFPSGANGDYAVRLAINNSGTTQATVGLHSAMLQFK